MFVRSNTLASARILSLNDTSTVGAPEPGATQIFYTHACIGTQPCVGKMGYSITSASAGRLASALECELARILFDVDSLKNLSNNDRSLIIYFMIVEHITDR